MVLSGALPEGLVVNGGRGALLEVAVLSVGVRVSFLLSSICMRLLSRTKASS